MNVFAVILSKYSFALNTNSFEQKHKTEFAHHEFVYLEIAPL